MNESFTYPDKDTLPLWCAIEIDGLQDEAEDMAAEIAELEAANRELKRQHVTVSNDLAHAQERIHELERREALLTDFVTWDDAWTYIDESEYQPGNHSKSWVEALKRRESARTALTAAGFPWPMEPVDAGEDTK